MPLLIYAVWFGVLSVLKTTVPVIYDVFKHFICRWEFQITSPGYSFWDIQFFVQFVHTFWLRVTVAITVRFFLLLGIIDSQSGNVIHIIM